MGVLEAHMVESGLLPSESLQLQVLPLPAPPKRLEPAIDAGRGFGDWT